MRIDVRSDRPLPLTFERALTALIQGRNSIEKARREFSNALEILSQLQMQSGEPSTDAEHLLGLRHALDQLEASYRSLGGPTAPASRTATASQV
jgi:hypothetical protein